MTKQTRSKEGFTLIEVMVAVMILSVVVMALMQMYANNTHIFSSLEKQSKTNQYSSFLIGNDTYGFEDTSISLDDLVQDFDIHNDLRRKLKEIKVELRYKELDRIDLSEASSTKDENLKSENSSGMVLEVGRSILKAENASSSLLRFKIK